MYDRLTLLKTGKEAVVELLKAVPATINTAKKRKGAKSKQQQAAVQTVFTVLYYNLKLFNFQIKIEFRNCKEVGIIRDLW